MKMKILKSIPILILIISLASCQEQGSDIRKNTERNQAQYILSENGLDSAGQTLEIRAVVSLDHSESLKYATWLHARLVGGQIDTTAFLQLLDIYMADSIMDYTQLPENPALQARPEFVFYLLLKNTYLKDIRLSDSDLQTHAFDLNSIQKARLEIGYLSGKHLVTLILPGCCDDANMQFYTKLLREYKYKVECSGNC
jgi:hypothetical protein